MPPKRTKKIKGTHPVPDHIEYKVVDYPASLMIHDTFANYLEMSIHQEGGWQHEASIRLTPSAVLELCDVLTTAINNAVASVQESV